MDPLSLPRIAGITLGIACLTCAQEPAQPADGDSGVALKARIDAGHAWLRRHQDEDGRWSASAFVVHDPKGDPCTGPGKPDQDAFVTSLVVTACYGIGELPSRTDNDHVIRATRWLASQIREDGSIGSPSSRTRVRDTAFASDVLAGAHRYGHPDGIGATMAATASWLEDQRGRDGLWPASPGADDDAPTTAMALEFLTQQGRDERAGVLEGLIAEDGESAAAGHAAAAFLAAWYVREPELRERCCAVLGKQLPSPDLPEEQRDPIVWYFTAQAMQFHDEATWGPWSRALVATATATQRRDGAHAGSWDPTGLRGREGGRVYTTAAMLMALEVVWRKEYRDR